MKTRTPVFIRTCDAAFLRLAAALVCGAAVLAGGATASAQPTVTATSTCPPLARAELQASVPAPPLGGNPLPAIEVTYTVDASVVGAIVMLEIPLLTEFAGILDAPSGTREWRDGTGVWTDFATPPPNLAAVEAVRVQLGNLSSGAGGTLVVAVAPLDSSAVALADVEAWFESNGELPVEATTGLMTNSCPMAIQVLKCFGAAEADGTCPGMYTALPNWVFDLGGSSGAALTPAAPASAPTDATGFTTMPIYVDADYLNARNNDVVNNSYPIAGGDYTVTEVLPAPVPMGPTWSASSPSTLAKEVNLPPFQELIVMEFANVCSCEDDNSYCTNDDCLPGPDGQGRCDYTPKPNGTGCDDLGQCFTDQACDSLGTCVGTPIACETPGACQASGVCNPDTGMCEYGADPDACDTMGFFGVLENTDGSLSSFQCEINTVAGAEAVACAVVGGGFATSGELQLGGPECIPPNLPPVFLNQDFTVMVGTAGTVVGTLIATDPESDTLTFSASDVNFSVSSGGVITIASGVALGQYRVVVSVDDGNGNQVFAEVLINFIADTCPDFSDDFEAHSTGPLTAAPWGQVFAPGGIIVPSGSPVVASDLPRVNADGQVCVRQSLDGIDASWATPALACLDTTSTVTIETPFQFDTDRALRLSHALNGGPLIMNPLPQGDNYLYAAVEAKLQSDNFNQAAPGYRLRFVVYDAGSPSGTTTGLATVVLAENTPYTMTTIFDFISNTATVTITEAGSPIATLVSNVFSSPLPRDGVSFAMRVEGYGGGVDPELCIDSFTAVTTP